MGNVGSSVSRALTILGTINQVLNLCCLDFNHHFFSLSVSCEPPTVPEVQYQIAEVPSLQHIYIC